MKIIGITVLIILGLGVLSLGAWGIGVISLPFRAAGGALNTANGIIDKTLTADNAIYNYEWFKQQVEDIKATENKVNIADTGVMTFEAAAGPRTSWTFEDKTEDARLRAVANGLRSQYEDLVATYNARSKEANRAIFQDGKIPSFIEIGARLLK